MSKYTKTATGIAQMAFSMPKASWDVSVTSLVPYDALVTKIKIEYIKVPRAEAEAAWKQSLDDFKEKTKKQNRHQAAVKANATRKARKAERESANA